MEKIGTILPPPWPISVPVYAQWVSGQGIGGWFHIEPAAENENEEYRIRRFSPKGKLECDRLFVLSNKQSFYFDRDYKFTHLSHCLLCTIIQDGKELLFKHTIK